MDKTYVGPISVVSPVRAAQHSLDNPVHVTDLLYGYIYIHRVIQEESALLWEMIV